MIDVQLELENNVSYLPYLLEDDIYLIEESSLVDTLSVNLAVASIKAEIETEILPLKEVIIPENINTVSEIKILEVAKPVQVAKEMDILPIITPLQPPVMQVEVAIKTFKKVVILVGYKEEIPKQVVTDLIKIFAALNISAFDLEIINVLDANTPAKINNYTYSYLILMGGNGKNLQALQNYQGTRNVFDLANHAGIKIFFAQAMDTYIKPENIEFKKKFWLKLKELFER